MPSTSARFGPPRRAARMPDLHGPGIEVQVAVPASSAVLPVTTWHPGDPAVDAVTFRPPPFQVPDVAAHPDLCVARITDARVVLPHGWVIAPGDVLVWDAMFGWEFPERRAVHRLPHARVARELPGRTVSLLSDFAVTNWSHFLSEAVPRRYLLDRAGVDLRTADRVLVPGLRSPTAAWVLDRLLPGVRLETVDAADTATLWCEELVVTALPGLTASYPAWLPPFVRSLARDGPDRRGPPIVLVRRGGTRPLLDEDRLAVALADRGFAVVQTGRGEEDVRAFAGAPIVVAAHGAGLANLSFCAPGTRVVELVPPGHEYPNFVSLSAGAGLVHHAVLGFRDRTARDADAGRAPYRVDVGAVLHVVDGLGSRPAVPR